MMNKIDYLSHLNENLHELRQQGLYKPERIIESPQQTMIQLNHHHVVNLCANNYLGLSDHPTLIAAAKSALDAYGYGMSSVRFICGTQTIHKALEDKLSHFLGMEDTILYSSCFDANTGLFETLLTEDDAIISDELNHASIIDGIRLCKAKRFRYKNNDMNDLSEQLHAAKSCRVKLIATDGVFSMDGIMANLPAICDLADKHNALVMVDDSHAVGIMGDMGSGTPAYYHLTERIDILTGTLGKALGGASGGYTSAKKPIIEWLRQRSRPYLFSNSLAPMIAATTIKALELLASNTGLRLKLHENSQYFRKKLQELGYTLTPGSHPIIPILIGDATLTHQLAEALLNEGIYVIGFSYPVVPHGKARIRTQMSAAHDQCQLDKAIQAFAKIGKELGIL